MAPLCFGINDRKQTILCLYFPLPLFLNSTQNQLAQANQTFNLNDWLWGIDGLERSSWAIYEYLGTFWSELRGKI